MRNTLKITAVSEIKLNKKESGESTFYTKSTHFSGSFSGVDFKLLNALSHLDFMPP